MKAVGILLLVVGLLMTLYTGVTLVTKEKVVDLGGLEVTQDDEHTVNWQPYVGLGAVAIGAILLLGRKKLLVA